MPQQTRALTRAPRDQAERTGKPYTQAREAVLVTHTRTELWRNLRRGRGVLLEKCIARISRRIAAS